jgi:hypothetical protein
MTSKLFQPYSLATDEHTDVKHSAQLAALFSRVSQIQFKLRNVFN